MGIVIDLFSGAEVVMAEQDEVIEAFVEEHLGDFSAALHSMVQAPSTDDFWAWMTEVKALVAAWPERPS